MKKSILSIFILSTTLFSTQSNAVEYTEKNVGTITINGSVTPNPRCQLDEIQPIELPPVQASNFGDNNIAKTPAQPLEIQFTNCGENINSVQLQIPKQTKRLLKNLANNGSNVDIAIFDTDKNIIELSNEKPNAFKTKIDKEDKSAQFLFNVNYMKPNGINATPGLVSSTLTFDVIYSDIAVD
ncbi:fimbrial protein [Proteus sp. G2669]|uniref:fimbrial protein n=1 Tax=unclassified Proteus (in: enterobacteria) TaxID=257482 RepID=UPI0014125C85|nr:MULTISPECIES: fimbrial protein [unclassified Proteus (in: enterobacteria)]NBM56555.1 fimbrial protein [Proteus sp. G2669]UDN38054.1 type 1 fimbrial protein [Proteus sp. NMG38-2]